MRRRLDLAASLVTEPVIFLDEPTTGLDLPGRLMLWQVITGLSRSGVTVFLTTQYLEEADQLADRIAVIDGGRVVAEGTPAGLKQQVTAQRLELRLTSAAAFEEVVRTAGDRVVRADRGGLSVDVATDGTAAQVRALLDELDPQRCAVQAFSVRNATLDDVFLTLTGTASRQALPAGHPSGHPFPKETLGV
jgi:ABC-2 type transport system ATP-binding protein